MPAPALLAIIATTLVRTIDECIQWFLPGLVFDPINILFNALAAVMAVASSTGLTLARRRSKS